MTDRDSVQELIAPSPRSDGPADVVHFPHLDSRLAFLARTLAGLFRLRSIPGGAIYKGLLLLVSGGIALSSSAFAIASTPPTPSHIEIFRSSDQACSGGEAGWYLNVAGDLQPDSYQHGCFGFATDTPITGDWSGSGTAKIGIVRSNDPSCSGGEAGWYLNVAGDMQPDSYQHGCFGFPSDMPIVGDWSGSGTAKIGIVRSNDPSCSGGEAGWYLNVAGDMQPDSYQHGCFGFPSDMSIVGDWNGSRATKIGIVRSNDPSCSGGEAGWYLNVAGDMQPDSYQHGCFGFPSDMPIVGDWNGSGTAKIGIVRSNDPTCSGGEAGWYLNVAGDMQPYSYQHGCFGFPSDNAIVGDWNGSGTTKIGVVRSNDPTCSGGEAGWYLNVAGDMQPDSYQHGCFGFPSDNPLRKQLQNFAPTPGIYYQITGQVTTSGAVLPGVTITLGGTKP